MLTSFFQVLQDLRDLRALREAPAHLVALALAHLVALARLREAQAAVVLVAPGAHAVALAPAQDSEAGVSTEAAQKRQSNPVGALQAASIHLL